VTIPGIDGAEWLIQEVIHEQWRWSSQKTVTDAEEVTQESPLGGKILLCECAWHPDYESIYSILLKQLCSMSWYWTGCL
jgi:hypothetical protein